MNKFDAVLGPMQRRRSIDVAFFGAGLVWLHFVADVFAQVGQQECMGSKAQGMKSVSPAVS